MNMELMGMGIDGDGIGKELSYLTARGLEME